MARSLYIRLACAAALLATGMTALVVSARMGVVQLEAGDITIAMGGGESGMVMNIATRTCPPDCNVGIDWRPVSVNSSSGF